MAFHFQNDILHLHHRLAEDSEYETIDYSVLSIGVQTLGLILFVEIIRHKLDRAAKGRPFFATVLHSVYSELSTLGIVELFVYLILKYYKDYNKAQKSVFADVHFALFYTAVFNAFQTVIVAITTMRKSNFLWVETEHLELDHYVEIREEFDRVREKYGYEIDDEFSSGLTFRNLPRYVLQRIRNPGLRGRYLNLLVQVNFHSLRLHFLQGNNLPLTLKVSDYLKRSEERVLEKLVHVSGGAWLMLTGGLNLIYFLMGVVSYVSEDQETVGLCLTCIFFLMMFVFIFICVALYFKMRNTFRAIITMKYEMNVDEKAREAGIARQLNLFWFQEPQFVISIIQFMQFGYALALAIVLMYWTSLTAIEPYWFLLAVLVCYGIFVFVLSMALPQYTLCTSLGYLVDQKNLMETVAVHRLEEARRLQLRTHTARFNFDDDSMIAFETHNDGENLQMEDSIKWGSSGRSNQSGLSIDSQRSTDKTQILAELVKSDTSSLRNLLPESSREILRSRERRRDRRKSVSDGVALMRALGGAIGDVASPSRTHPSKSHQLRAVDDSDILKRDRAERAAKRKARKKTASASEVIQSWHNMTKPGTKKLDENSSALGSGDRTIPKARMQQRAERIAQRRQSRLKSKSESAVIRTWNGSTAAEEDWRAIREQKLLTTARDHESIPVMEAPDLPPVDEATLPLPIQRHHGTQSDRKLTTQSSHQSIQDENSTLRTDESVGLLSDVDVQQWDAVGDIESNLDIKRTWNLGKMVKVARDYFLDDRYHTISHVFGSLIVFFLVGHRLEVMLSKTGAVDPSENTWELDLGVSFWIETFWLAFFIIAGTLILLLFLPVEEKSTNHRVVITSAVLDILLSCACLAILFLAEAQRCCDGDEPDRGIDCCPFWGSRTHSGLGDLEPFTALIGLRVFRFVVSRQLVEYFDDRSEMGIGAEERGKEALEQHSRHGNNLVGSSMQTETGTPLVLWETAISKYPDIVEKYGELSTELFQAMLGLIDANSIQPTGHSSVQLDNKVTHQLSSSDDGQHGIKIGENQSIKLSGTRYATLPAEAQSIIIAGKLGMPVKSIKRLRENRTDLPAVFEEPEHDTFGFHQPSSVQGTAKFEIDSAKLALEETSPSNFLAPNARLIRSMRRCDRRMLPILTDWGCVDVVITQFEMVYFEAVRLIEPASPNLQDHPSLLALQATKGGKGLRLHDVAMGRKIVGHLDLSDITEVHVDRSLALPDSATTKSPTAIEADDVAIPTEFWSKPGSGGCTKHKRQARWAKIKEDRLRLVTLHGCLVLRFYSDLDDVEVNAAKSLRENEAQGALRKNIALQWAQTISHSVGREKLHQPLPNFGANNSDELRDLLQAKNFHEKEQEENLKSSNGFGPTTLGASTEVPTKEVRSKPSFRRSRSLSSDDTFKHRLRRHLSMSAVGELANETKPVKDGVTSNDTETIDASLQQQGRGHITF